MKNLLFFLLLVIAPQAFAGPFDPPPTDQSVNLLGVIFGSNIGSIPLGGSPNPVLSELMEKFNFIIVVAGLIIVSYVGILSIINTAHEGTAMGKKWSAVWVPFRSIAGLGLMVPAPESGYSMIQVTVMWIIIQGIGAADALWNIALDGLADNVSVSAGTQISNPIDAGTGLTMADDATNIAEQLLNAQTCMAQLYQSSFSEENQNNNSSLAQIGQLIQSYTKVTTDASMVGSSTSCSATVDGFTNRFAKMEGFLYFGVPNSSNVDEQKICGSIKVTGSVCASEFSNFSANTPSDNDLKNVAAEIYYTKLNAISTMQTVLQPLADGLAKDDYVVPLEAGGTNNNTEPPAGYIGQATTQYLNILGGMVVQSQGGASDISSELQTQIQLGKQNGWIAAGSYYFIFNQVKQGTLYLSVTKDPITVTANSIPSCSGVGCTTGFSSIPPPINNLLNNEDKGDLAYKLGMADAYAKSASAASRPTVFRAPGAEDTGAASAMGAIGSFNSRAIQDIANLFNTQDPSVDPLYAISRFGRSIMLGVEATILSVISISLGVGFLSMIQSIFGFWGITLYGPNTGAFFQTLAIITLALLAVFLPVLLVMWAYGAMLAVYLPLIPFMIFTMAALGWMLTIVESIIAAPIVALGLVLPSGDELGKAEHALALLANIFLRPMLMILGFLIASRVFKAVILLVNFGMGGVFDSIDISTLFSTLVVIAVYATFIISIANTCFSLIYAVPDKILRWIGGPSEQTDVGAVAEAKSGATQTAQTMSANVKEIGKEAGKKAIAGAAGKLNQGMNAVKNFIQGKLGKK